MAARSQVADHECASSKRHRPIFQGRVAAHLRAGEFNAIRAEVAGRAYYTGRATFTVEPEIRWPAGSCCDEHERVSIIGAGAWGTALSLIASRAGRATTLYARRAAFIRQLRKPGECRLSARITLPDDLLLTPELDRALDADAILYAQPAQHFRAFVTRAAALAWERRAGAVRQGDRTGERHAPP